MDEPDATTDILQCVAGERTPRGHSEWEPGGGPQVQPDGPVAKVINRSIDGRLVCFQRRLVDQQGHVECAAQSFVAELDGTVQELDGAVTRKRHRRHDATKGLLRECRVIGIRLHCDDGRGKPLLRVTVGADLASTIDDSTVALQRSRVVRPAIGPQGQLLTHQIHELPALVPGLREYDDLDGVAVVPGVLQELRRHVFGLV